MMIRLSYYSAKEEKINVYSHAVGAVLALVALFFLGMKSFSFHGMARVSFWIYGFSQIIIFSVSALYHAQRKKKRRSVFNILDHSAIYVSIAGSYTPYCLVSFPSDLGYFLFWLVWGIAFAGVALKVFFTGRFNLISTILYVAMGWLIVFYWSDLKEYLRPEGLYWLIYGGIAYSVGAVLYMIPKLPYNHAIFHFFVLLGAMCHFISIYFYV